MYALGILTAALILIGLLLLVIALTLSNSTKDRTQLLGGLSTGLLTGAVFTVGVLVLQLRLQAYPEEAVWRANVTTAVEIPGFTAVYPLHGLNLSGKQLPDAELRGVNLKGIHLRDTVLTGADLTGAKLQGAVMYSANLATANLTRANLSNAKLEGVRFDDAQVEHVTSFKGAEANAATCWPGGFLELTIAKDIRAVPFRDAQGNIEVSRGREYPHCLKTL